MPETCPSCGFAYTIHRDADGTYYRPACPCEQKQPCHQCKRGRVTHAVLSRTHEVSYLACKRHGVTEESLPLDEPLEDPLLVAAQELKEAAQEFRQASEAPAVTREAKRETVRSKAQRAVDPGVVWVDQTLKAFRCTKCQVPGLTSAPIACCPGCGASVTFGSEEHPIEIGTVEGPNGLGLVITSRLPGGTYKTWRVTLTPG
jgi:hypothetical protein